MRLPPPGDGHQVRTLKSGRTYANLTLPMAIADIDFWRVLQGVSRCIHNYQVTK